MTPSAQPEEQRIVDDLPDLYARLFPQFFHLTIPRETLATCNDCAMQQRPGQPVFQGQDFFRPDIKCCSFHPKLPNYLIGGLLSDTNPGMDHGRDVVRAKIQRRTGVAPSCILPDRKYALLHAHGGERAFGKNTTLKCPYFIYETGLCSVWKFREAVCSTYFCKCMAGQEGKRFWNVLRAYLMQIQDMLMWHSLLQLGFEVEPIWDYLSNYGADQLDARDVDELRPDDTLYRRLWGGYEGREEEFYIRAYEVISALTPEEFDRLCGTSVRIFEKWLERRHQQVVSPELPETLIRNPELKSLPAPGGTVAVRTDAGVYTLDGTTWEILGLFDGRRSTAEVRQIALQRFGTPHDSNCFILMYQRLMIVPA